MWAIELVGPGKCESYGECKEGQVGQCCCGSCSLCDGDRGDSKNYKVVGPNDSKDEIWWLPCWLIECAIPVVSGVNPQP